MHGRSGKASKDRESLRSRLFLWFSSTGSAESREVRARLLETTYERKAFIYFGAVSIMMLTVTAAIVSGKSWPYVWLAADLAIVAIRLRLLAACEKAQQAGADPPLGALMAGGAVWSVVTGLGCFACVMSGHAALAVLAGTNVAAMLGAISARNAATPRYATLVMMAISLPYGLAAFLSPISWLFVVGLQLPLHLAGMIVLLRKNHESLVRLFRAELRNRELAMTDALTGLPNRVSMNNELARLCEQSQRKSRSGFAILSLDLDGFKSANDRHGHAAGDELLTMVAQRLKRGARLGDFVCRLGGDEFVILLPDASALEAAYIAKRVIEKLSAPFRLKDETVLSVGVSVGSAFAPQDGTTPETLLVRSDNALYEAKRSGKGQYVPYARAG